MHRMQQGGVYAVENTITGTRYLGSAVRFASRRSAHWWRLRSGKHQSPELQAEWNQYGETAFRFVILAVLERSELLPTEQRLLNRAIPAKTCCNASPVARANMLGRRVPDASIQRAHAFRTGKPLSDLTRDRIRAARSTPEARARSAAARRGKVMSAETRAKISAARKELFRQRRLTTSAPAQE